MKAIPLPPVEFLNECFSLEEPEGNLKWKVRPRSHFKNDHVWKIWNSKFSLSDAGVTCVDHRNKYRRVKVNRTKFQAHRIIYALRNGSDIPAGKCIDHIDGNGLNNRADNHRLVTVGENRRNCRLALNNRSGITGVSRVKRSKKWVVRMQVSNVRHYEYFDTKEEAIAYNTAIRSASGAFTERHGHDTNDY
ncbi:TPA: HNH endonuclease [Serratia marcescens]|nr:HNH endonuclease [Serratia marcescens]